MMQIKRPWAFWRRVQYGTGFGFVLIMLFAGVYMQFLYTAPSCFDDTRNGDERGVDCGGSCARICAMDVEQPRALWARAFRVTDGQYNAVAYVENRNLEAGTPRIGYTFSLYDTDGLITERTGTTVLPPDSTYPIFEGRIDTGTRKPTEARITLGEAVAWLPAETGREQFVVERRELSGAGREPRLDATIRNTALTEAEDVEIVATIFDSRGTALTSSRTIVQEFPGRTTKDVVFTWPEPIAKTVRSCEVPTDVLLGIDLSGSMNDDGGTPPQPITSVLTAAGDFVERLQEGDQAGVVTYATEATVEAQLTPNRDAVRGIIAGLSIDPAEERGSTNTGAALMRGEEELNSPRHNFDARRVMVLLSDGLATAPDEDPEEYALEAAATLKESGVEVFTIGLGEQVDADLMRQIASSNEHYFPAASGGTLDRIYRSITESICEDGAAVIEIIPKAKTSFAPLQ